SDEGVFGAFLLISGEGEWLVRNIAQFGDNRARIGSDGDDISFGFAGLFLFVAAAADEEQAGGAGELIRLHDGEPMLPEGSVDLVGGEPRLRNHIDDVRGIAFAPDGTHQMPRVVRIWRGDVTVERGLRTQPRALGGRGEQGHNPKEQRGSEREGGSQRQMQQPRRCAEAKRGCRFAGAPFFVRPHASHLTLDSAPFSSRLENTPRPAHEIEKIELRRKANYAPPTQMACARHSG